MSGKPSVVKPAKSAYGKSEKRSMEALLGKPVCAAPSKPETRAQRVMHLGQRARVLARGNPYQASFYKFLTELVYTKDEASLRVAKFPAHPYILDLCDDLVTEPLLIWEKSRRVLASWLACAFDIWLLAGGMDPRRKALMNSPNHRLVVLAADKLEDLHGSAWYLESRVQFIYEELERRNVRDQWPEFPKMEFRFSVGRASNGGRIYAVPHGSDQMRGAGITQIHAEELAIWAKPQAAIMGALPTLTGQKADERGFFLGITNASNDSWVRELVQDLVDP